MICSATLRVVDESPRAWWLSLGISMGIHIFLLIIIVAWTVSGAFELRAVTGTQLSLEMIYDGSIVQPNNASQTDPVENILGSIPERIQQMQKLSRKEKAAIIKQGKKDLSMVRESSLNEIADLFAVENRAYQPADPAPDGPFDFDSQIPYSMAGTATGGCTMVLIDKDGRTLELVYSAEDMTEDLRAAVEIFKMMDQMPALRKVYMRIAVRFLPEFTNEGDNDD